ncbi:probable inactive ATP-dependent zinc metalloprotease FTSHI 5, chloroplastic [Durio zibethinus]|uniref:Probable inactive ATP-dependent zinc metalloprotease FTSHI 5, chloroplastic n=1 Tax=Durio zibethinus TaxID=66656 RepID=A0A6P5WTL0_DURZI|nr:probable inactive ATP-dependent zinc metalloprotease FTSHI 5, chloroplastic [Durio zibethinus]
MASIFTSLCHSQLSPLNFRTRHLIRTNKFTKKPIETLPIKLNFKAFTFRGTSQSSKPVKNKILILPRREPWEEEAKISSGYFSFQCLVKNLAFTLLCFAIGLSNLSPNGEFKGVAMAAIVEKVRVRKKEAEKKGTLRRNEHEFSDYTRRLLEVVSRLLRRVEGVRSGNGDVKEVGEVLKAVKVKKEELQGEIMRGLHGQLMELKKQKAELEKRAVDEVAKVGKKKGKVVSGRGGKGKGKGKDIVEKLEEEEYNGMWERIGEIEDEILRRETTTLSIGVRELCFIERECVELVKRFNSEMSRKGHFQSPQKSSITNLSRSEIRDELETAKRKHFEQMLLPSVVEVEDLGPFFNQDSVDFALRIKQCLKDSREMQRNLESGIRRRMKKFGSEKRFVVKTAEDEVVKGFPEVELKRMFGEKEVVVPKAISLHLYHGWKRWCEEDKANLKRHLLEDAEFGKHYVAQRQERILLDRDRVVAKTWYNEERSRWEMDPMAVPYAVSKKLVEHARIRHDWAMMYIALKGDDKEYFVDIKEFDMLYENSGGFDGLYLKMLACGIPAAVQLMYIPFSELNFCQQFLLTTRLAHQCLTGLWKTKYVALGKDWVYQKFKTINDDIMAVVVFPLIDSIVFPLIDSIFPYLVMMQLGMTWPTEIAQTISTWYIRWQAEAEMNLYYRKTDDSKWFLWFLIGSTIYGFILYHAFRFLRRKVPKVLGYGPIRKDPNMRKLRRVKGYFNYRLRRMKRKKKAGIDPIKTAFDGMKRVKNPPIPLKDFASIESMREEINEVVAFLQNPGAFQEMGACAPRGVLIVGERGTGKTSLALAIAAEARVPVVNVEAQQLEAGLWVGQSASNVRELFQTARDLAPVIIFVEDFDLFAGVRGRFIHTKQQDHEAFINQLLVELDGFEKQDGVVLMATTRNIKQIDKALKRPGRMDRVFHLQRPTEAERERILQIAAKETMAEELINLVDWKKVAEKTAFLRPTELKLVPVALEGSAFRSKFLDRDELMSYCSWFATFSGMIPEGVRKTKIVKQISQMLVNHLGLTLTKEDLQNVVDLMEPYGQISNGIELLNPPFDWTRETKFPHAVWAAGRGLITLLLPNFDVVDNLWLEPCSWKGIGCTKITKARNEATMYGNEELRSYLEKKLVFCFGSYIAAQLLLPFGEENFLSASELKQAQEIATRMVIQYGWGPDDSPAIYCSRKAVTALSIGNNHEFELATKVEKIYDLAYEKAKEMLKKNRQVLEKIVEELLEFEMLTGKDLERIFNETGGIREKEPFILSHLDYREPLYSSFLDEGNALGTSFLDVAA